MQLSQLVTSLETSQKLKELGVEQSSLFYWVTFYCINKIDIAQQRIIYKDEIEEYAFINHLTVECSAFLSGELGELLPLFEVRKKGPDYYRSGSKLVGMNDYFMSDEESMVESMAKTYIYLKENNLVGKE